MRSNEMPSFARLSVVCYVVRDSHDLEMGPKNMFFSKDIECTLIEMVRQRPLLWDTNIEEYRRTDLKRMHWDQIAQALGPNLTGDMVHKRFQNMESTFRANERKIRESKARCSGKGTDEIYKPKWDYYDLLSFLKKTCVQTDSIDNLCLQSQSSQSSQSSLFSQEAMSSPISPCSENSSMFINVYYDENAQQYISIPPDSSGSSNIVDTSNNETPSLIHSESYISAEPSLNRSISNTTASSTKQSQSVISNMASRMATPPLRPEGAPIKTKRLEKRSEEPIYVKRGSSKKFNIMEEAVDAIKNMAQQDLSPKTDRFDMLGAYVASRLRSMTSEDQVYYEREILKVLTQRLD